MSNKHVRIKVPTTCGELIQGPYLAKESLISLPINLYTEVEARLVKGGGSGTIGKMNLQPKASAGFLSAVKHLGLSDREASQVEIALKSPVAHGKGYASSTSDLCGVMAAVFELFDAAQPAETLAELCAAIEPSDGLMFRDWTLFNHLSGKVLRQFKTVEHVKLLILEPPSICVTDTFRSTEAVQAALGQKTDMPFWLFEKASREGSVRGMFQAAGASVLEHQAVLKKPYLEAVMALAEREGAYGVVGAHSGTILGIAMPEALEEAVLIERLREIGALDWYQKQLVVQTVLGGYNVL